MDESIAMQIAKINTNIRGVFGRRRTALLALCIPVFSKGIAVVPGPAER